MRTFFSILLVLATFGSFIETVGSEEVSVQEMPPVVVKTIPKSGATGVDPSLSEIEVTFSKEMMARYYAMVEMSPANYPDFIGDPQYLPDKRTWVLKVKLIPGKTYAVWFNNVENVKGFRDLAGRSAVPYLLVFETSR